MSEIDWNDDAPAAPPVTPDPYPKNPRATEPIVARTASARTGPLFGKWSAHLAYLNQREAELAEEMELIRMDKIEVQRRARESPDHE